ncbi:MAG: membrane dipeptidase [Vicinamibacterales bacterium]|nr:membrane dipeptidase [Vicinamibacterales bacterium]
MTTPAARPHGGFHSTIDADHPYLFIDSCMQIWPDADFASAHRHGVAAYGVTAFMPHDDFATAVEHMMFWHLVARRHPHLYVVDTVEDVRRGKRDGRAGLLLFAQGGDFIGWKLHRIEAMQRLGLRVMIPAYNRTNHLCDGILDRTEGGLSRFGQAVVDECHRAGVVVDCTHLGARSSLEIIDRSPGPVIFSHSNPRALADNPRNISDAEIVACIGRGGVVGCVSWGPLVMRTGTTHWPTLDEFLACIDHVAQLAGNADHIGIGTDMSLGSYPPHETDPWGEPAYVSISEDYGRHVTPDIRSPRRAVDGFSDYPEIVNVANGLLARGYTDAQVHGILGENYLRVFEQVWR